jgi:acid phosphatase
VLRGFPLLTDRYDRTPPCSLADPTQCSQFFHEVTLEHLHPGKTYYYRIPGGNGTTASDVLSTTAALGKGDSAEFSVAVLADMGYTNAKGTHEKLVDAVQDGVKWVWHGGDICQ